VLLLPLTLAWKLTVGLDDSNELKYGIAEFLVEHQFDVVETKRFVEDMLVLSATKGACRMRVLKVSSYGWDRQMGSFGSSGGTAASRTDTRNVNVYRMIYAPNFGLSNLIC
jgi:hypothetical protein